MCLSVALHVAALALVSLGSPGVPWGVQGSAGDLYSLSYLGEVSGAVRSGEGPTAAPGRAKTVEVRVEPAAKPPANKTAAKPVPRTPAKPTTNPPAKPATAASGELLSSPRGGFAVPLAEKPVTAKPSDPPKASADAPVEPAAGPGPGENGGGLPPPKGTGLVSAIPKLVYPKDAQNSGAKGIVGLRVAVNTDGRVTRVEVERSSGDRRLDAYAQRAVERGLISVAWSAPYVLHVEAHFLGGVPEVRVSDAPVEVGG